VKFRPPTQDDYNLLDEMAALGRWDAGQTLSQGTRQAITSESPPQGWSNDVASWSPTTEVTHQAADTFEPLKVKSSFSVGNESAAPTTDWGGVAGAGIGAAGQMVGTLAQVAGNKYAMDRQMEASGASRALSEKLAKMQIAASQEDYLREQNLRALLWALGANKGQQAISAGGREVRRGAIDGMDDLLAKVMLKRG
jgi:hypothetical protein